MQVIPITPTKPACYEPHCLMAWNEMCAGMDDMAEFGLKQGDERPLFVVRQSEQVAA